MSAQPEHAAPPSARAPAAAAQLLAELGASSQAASWVPAFERGWTAALDDALVPLHTVVAAWTARRHRRPRRPWDSRVSDAFAAPFLRKLRTS